MEVNKRRKGSSIILILQYKCKIYFKIKINQRIIKVRIICEVHNMEENQLKFSFYCYSLK